MASIPEQASAAGAAPGGPVPGPRGAPPPPPPLGSPPDPPSAHRPRSEGPAEIELPPAPLHSPRGGKPVTTSGPLEWLERSLFIRIGRTFFFLSAVLAMLAVLGGLGAGGLGFMEDKVPPPPEVAPVSPPQPVAYAVVQQILARKRAEEAALRQAQAAPASSPEPASGRPEANPAPDRPVTELQRQLDRLRSLFPNPPYVWDDVYENYCRVPSPFGCLSVGQRLVKQGISEQVERRFRMYDADDVLPVLQAVNDVLAEAPVDDRFDLLPIIIEAFKESHEAYRERVQQREQQIAEAQARYQDDVSREQEKRATYRQYGMYGALGGLGMLVLVSIFLVHFAMERHLRLLRQLLEGSPGARRQS